MLLLYGSTQMRVKVHTQNACLHLLCCKSVHAYVRMLSHIRSIDWTSASDCLRRRFSAFLMMFTRICRSVCHTACVVAPTAKFQVARRMTRSLSSADRNYPGEPRVGVGVVILRPSTQSDRSAAEVRYSRGVSSSICSFNAFCCCRFC